MSRRRVAGLAIALAIACRGNARRVDLANGGSEIVLGCADRRGAAPEAHVVQDALERAGEITEVTNLEGSGGHQLRVITNRFGGVGSAVAPAVEEAFAAAFRDREISRARWSGERFYVRSRRAIAWSEAAPIFAARGVELRRWDDATATAFARPDEGTGEYATVFAIAGIDRMIQTLVERSLGVSCDVASFASVGPQHKQ